MTTISAKTILRSRNLAQPNKVVSTLLLRYPRWIHAEGRTHRQLDITEDFAILVPTPSLMECDDFSRNAGSSRAIPVEKLIQDVLDDPAVPLFWGKNERGMQANEELPPHLIKLAREEWFSAMHDAIYRARRMAILDPNLKIGAHKQIVNRLLEPFSHITVLVTATEWNNFRALRDHGDAEPHIRKLAQEIGRELDRTDNIQDLAPGEWHLPFVEAADRSHAVELASAGTDATSNPHTTDGLFEQYVIKLSVARCASTSYKTVDGFAMDDLRAIALHDKLVSSTPLHASPAEHQCQADGAVVTADEDVFWRHPELHGNLIGFKQYRKMLPNEAVPG